MPPKSYYQLSFSVFFFHLPLHIGKVDALAVYFF